MRLWPLSREQRPKQFLPLTSNFSMLQETIRRLRNLADAQPAIIVCGERHRFLVHGHLQEAEFPYQSIILEPSKRGTAPAAVIAAIEAMTLDEESLILVLAADHIIGNEQAFGDAVTSARSESARDHLMTFGVEPNRPETGFGYLRQGKKVDTNLFKLAEFVEKPDRQTAQGYLSKGGWYWNSGIFLFPAKVFLEEVETYQEEMFKHCQLAHQRSQLDGEFIRVSKGDFDLSRNESIDRAIMEKTAKAMIIPLQSGWSDVGSWESIWEVGQKDPDGNVTQGDVVSLDTHNSYMHSESRLISAVGVEELVIVESVDAVLVMPRNRAQDVQQVVAKLDALGRTEQEKHPKVYRPWGSYETVDSGEGFHVKRITIYPRSRLSLQSHEQRAEHWVVVSGEAIVTRGNEKFSLNANASTYISPGTIHRLENSGNEDLVLIEVQTGTYFGEDDIVRYEDDFGRETNDC